MGLASRDPFLGLTLDGKYEIASAIARGGMGRVYRAIQRPLGREVALKVLDMEQLEGKKAAGDFAKRFFLEAASCAKLTHPNTVVVYDYGKTEDDVFYIAMELLQGNTLDRILDEIAPLDPATTVHIALQICGSIGEAHQLGMVHRDLKPSNIMLTKRGGDPNFVKVLDFGLVKDEADVGLTQSGALLGTPRYIAPEQIANSDVGPESDIYSFGAILYHCLTGRPPFDSDSKFVLLASHINVKPPDIEELRPDTPASEELRALIMKCLQKERADRFQSMAELVQALQECPEETNTSASSLTDSVSLSDITIEPRSVRAALDQSGVKKSSVAETMAASPSAKVASVVEPTEQKKPNMVLIALVALLVGVGGVVAWWMSSQEPEPEPVAQNNPEPPPDTTTMVEEPTDMDELVPRENRVRLESDPPGARVRRDGNDLGDTPLMLVVPEGESWQVEVYLRGYETRSVTVTAGQETARVRLERRGRGMRMRADTMEQTTTTMAETMVETTVTPMMTTPMMTTPMMTTRTHMTDNVDPWAR